jgi:signal transduction histidine kinase
MTGLRTQEYARIDTKKFKVFDVDARTYTRSLLTGDAARDNRNVSMLLATVNAANSAVGIREVSKRFVDMVVVLTGADRGLLLLLREGALVVDVTRARDGRDLPATDAYSHSIPRQVFDSGEPVCIIDAAEGAPKDLGASVSALDLRTVMCAPLRVRDETLGVMYVDSKLANREFTDADLHFFEAVCQQMAVTLENSRLNQTVVQAERLATVGQMTSMILHDLGGPMTVLSNYADLLEGHEEASEDIRHMASEMRVASDKAMAMLRSVLDFARGSTSYDLHPYNLAMLVRTVVGQRVGELGKRLIHLDMDLRYRGKVFLDPQRMERVLTNLLNNAVDAMPEGGELRVSIRDAGGGTVALLVSDTGVGIAPDRIGAIFEPFVTHGKKKGTGLGLAIVKQIIDNHGGAIVCESEPGRGTTFTITLPAASG